MNPVSASPLLHLDRVSYSVGGVQILDNITLAVPPGEPTVVMGPNGAGKTTLLRVLMGLRTPTQGTVRWSPAARHPVVPCAMVFQRPVMLRRGALANIEYALAMNGHRG